MNEMVWKQEYQMEKIAFAITAIIIINILSFPVTISKPLALSLLLLSEFELLILENLLTLR